MGLCQRTGSAEGTVPRGAARGHLGEAGPYLAPEILCQVNPCEALESHLAQLVMRVNHHYQHYYYYCATCYKTLIWVCLRLSFESGLPSRRIEG